MIKTRPKFLNITILLLLAIFIMSGGIAFLCAQSFTPYAVVKEGTEVVGAATTTANSICPNGGTVYRNILYYENLGTSWGVSGHDAQLYYTASSGLYKLTVTTDGTNDPYVSTDVYAQPWADKTYYIGAEIIYSSSSVKSNALQVFYGQKHKYTEENSVRFGSGVTEHEVIFSSSGPYYFRFDMDNDYTIDSYIQFRFWLRFSEPTTFEDDYFYMKGGYYPLTSTNPTRSGYTFAGWKEPINTTYSFTIYDETNNFKYAEIATLTAKGAYDVCVNSLKKEAGVGNQWIMRVYDMTADKELARYNNVYDASGGNYSIVVPQTADLSHTIKLLVYPYWPGQTAGVKLQINGIFVIKSYRKAFGDTSVSYGNMSTVYNNTSSGKVFVASWKPNIYSITLDSKYYSSTSSTGTSVNSAGTSQVYYEKDSDAYFTSSSLTTQVTKITIPTKTGYTFGGYYTSKTGTGDKCIDKDGTFYSSTCEYADNRTLYAKWTPTTYTVTLNNQSATSAGTTAVYYKYGTSTYYSNSGCTTTISTITKPTKTGYIFGGYYTSTNGGGTQYITSSGTFTNNLYNQVGNRTLYAYWKTPTLTMNGNGGTVYYNYFTPYAYRENWTQERSQQYDMTVGDYPSEYWICFQHTTTYTINADLNPGDIRDDIDAFYWGGRGEQDEWTVEFDYGCEIDTTTAYVGVYGYCQGDDPATLIRSITLKNHDSGRACFEDLTGYDYYYIIGWWDGIYTDNSVIVGGVNVWNSTEGVSGTSLSTNVLCGSYYTLPAPYRSGYTFTGWTFSSTPKLVMQSDEDPNVYTIVMGTSDITATANWKPNTYKVTYNANGGSLSSSYATDYVSYNGTYAGKSNVYYDILFANLGLNRGTGGNAFYLNKDNSSGTSTAFVNFFSKTANMKYWPSTQYTVAVQVTEFSGDSFNITFTSPNDETNGDISTAGCSISVTGTGIFTTTFTTKADMSAAVYALRSYIPIYAGKKSTASFYVGVYAGHLISPTGVTAETSGGPYPAAGAQLPTPTRTGYTFAGWWTTASGGTQVIATTKVTSTSNHTLYAHWTPNVYTVTLNNQSATSAGTTAVYYKYAINTYYSNSGCTAQISSITCPTRTGYTFGGYYSSTGGSGTQYITAAGAFTNNLYNLVGNRTLYAKWTANTYNVVLDTASATAGTTSVTATYGSAMPTITKPYRVGYTFGGYYGVGTRLAVSGTSAWASQCRVNFALNAVTVGNTIAISAVSNVQITSLDFNDTGIPSSDWNQVKSGDLYYIYCCYKIETDRYPGEYCFVDFNAASMPTLTNVIAGTSEKQYYKSDGTSASNWDIAANSILVSRWTANNYTVTVDPNGGTYSGSTGTKSLSGTYLSTTTIADPTRTGYTFAGWMAVKQINSAYWAQILYHNNIAGSQLFSSSTNLATTVVNDGNKNSQFATLSKLGLSEYEFLLQYDHLSGKYNHWTQTSNPATSTSVTGYTAKTINWTDNSWGGIARSSASSTFIDGSPSAGTWFYALGSYESWSGGVPGPSSAEKDKVLLWLKTDATLSNFKPTASFSGADALGSDNKYYFKDENVTLKALWFPNTYTVTLNNQSATSAGTTAVYYKYATNKYYSNSALMTQISSITVPTRAGYGFGGYYTGTNGTGTQYITAAGAFTNNLYNVASNQTLYAKWTANTYTVVFNKNKPSTASSEVSGTMANMSISYDVEKALTSNAYSLTGWTFTNWNTKADGTGTTYTNGKAVKNLTTSGTFTLYAQWSANTYTVVYNGNGATGGSTESSSHTYDVAKNLTANGFTKTGHSFKNWNTKADGTGTSYTNSQSVKNLATSGTFNLYAQWTPNAYAVTINPNGGTYEGSTANKTLTGNYGATTTISKPVRTGYTFNGYTLSGSGTISEVVAGGNATATSKADSNGAYTNYVLSGDHTENSSWKNVSWANYSFTAGKTYVLSFKVRVNKISTGSVIYFRHSAVGNNWEAINKGFSAATGWTYVELERVIPASFDRSGTAVTCNPKFEAYTNDLKGSGSYNIDFDIRDITVYQKDTGTTAYSSIRYTYGAANTTLTAQWTANTYTVTYNGNGNTGGSTAASTHTYGTAKALTANGFTKTGYSFAGWNTKADGTGTTYADKASVTNLTSAYNGSVTLYAQWQVNAYALVENANGGTMSAAKFNSNSYLTTAVKMDWSKDFSAAGSFMIPAQGARYFVLGAYSGNSLQIEINSNNVIRLYTEIGGTIDHTGTKALAANTWYAYHVTYNCTTGLITLQVLQANGTIYDTVTTTVSTKTGTATNAFRLGTADYRGSSSPFSAISLGQAVLVVGGSAKVYVPISATQWKETIGNTTLTISGTSTLTTATLYGASIIYNSTYNALGTPTRTGYAFNGWFTATSGGTKVESTTKVTVTANQTIYAQWTANTYSVVFNKNKPSSASNEVTGTMSNQSIKYDVSQALTANAYGLTGWTFNGWNTKADGSGTAYADKASVKNLATSGTFNLYAQWTQNSYSVVFNKNKPSNASNEVTGTMNNQAFKYDNSEQALTANAYGLIGWTFTGWNTAANGSGTAYANSAKVKNLATSGTFNLYAQWRQNTYTVTFNANGGSTPSPATKTVTYDSTYGTLATTSLTGHSFQGWYTAASGGTKIETTTKVTITANQTLYAQWKANTYTLSWNGNGATLNSKLWNYAGSTGYTSKNTGSNSSYTNDGKTAKSNIVYNTAIGYTAPIPQKIGHTFTGWWTATTGGTQIANADGTVKASVSGYTDASKNWIKADNTTMYAQWSKNNYTLTYELNGGGATLPSTYSFGTKTTISNPTRTGYTFTGWTIKSMLTGKAYGTINLSTGVLEYDSQYENAAYFPLFYQEANVTYSATVSDVNNDIRWRHYSTAGEFSGTGNGTVTTAVYLSLWYHGGMNSAQTMISWNQGTNYSISANQVGNLILTANWSTKAYTLTADAGDWTIPDTEGWTVSSDRHTATKVVAYEDQYGTLPVATKAGWGFTGWFTEKSGGTQVKPSTKMGASDTTIYVQGEKSTYTLTANAHGGTMPDPLPSGWTSTSSQVATKNLYYKDRYDDLPEPTRQGFIFAGWFTADSNGTEVDSRTQLTVESDVTIHAHWVVSWISYMSETNPVKDKDGYYKIDSAKDLARLAYLVNENIGEWSTYNYKLTADIDLSVYYDESTEEEFHPYWDPIGIIRDDFETSLAFKGTFDGKTHDITGLKTWSSERGGDYNSQSYMALFRLVQDATIKNVNMYDIDVRGAWLVSSVVCMSVCSTISDCRVTGGVVYCDGDGGVGGVVGEMAGGIMSNCENYATIDSGIAGGIVMAVFGAEVFDETSSEPGIVENCTNYGTLTGCDYEAGGIAAVIVGNGIVRNCVNVGSINATKSAVGGIIGEIEGGSVMNCVNQGTITGGNTIGGIVGSVDYASCESTITECVNTGELVATNSSAYIGAILGRVDTDAEGVTITSCFAECTITAPATANVGGVVAYANEALTITYCGANLTLTTATSNLQSFYSAGSSEDVTCTNSYSLIDNGGTQVNRITTDCSDMDNHFGRVEQIHNGLPIPLGIYHVSQYGTKTGIATYLKNTKGCTEA